MDELPAKAILKENTNLKILDTELFTDSYGMSIIIFLLFLIFVLLLYIAIKIENMNK